MTPHLYLLREHGFLSYTVLMRAQIHTNALYTCSKIDYLSDPQELCQELKLDNHDHFTYGAYYKLLWNAVCDIGISPTPWQTGKLPQSPSDKECDKELLCYIWQTIAGPIHYYLNSPLLAYWFTQLDDFYTTASNFFRNNKPGLLTDNQTALIPWVESIVIKHYVLGKDILFADKITTLISTGTLTTSLLCT
jgi:hypothetical protein